MVTLQVPFEEMQRAVDIHADKGDQSEVNLLSLKWEQKATLVKYLSEYGTYATRYKLEWILNGFLQVRVQLAMVEHIWRHHLSDLLQLEVFSHRSVT